MASTATVTKTTLQEYLEYFDILINARAITKLITNTPTNVCTRAHISADYLLSCTGSMLCSSALEVAHPYQVSLQSPR